ncbi:hypothetical protein MASR2M39_30120 [Ignavibacteriales bacterium]
MSVAITTKTQVPNINAYYDRTLLERATPLLLHTKFGQVRDIPKNNSDVIKFRKYSALSAASTPLTEGVTPNGSQLAVTDSTATVLRYGDYVTLTDKLKTETEDAVETEATQILAEQAALTLDGLAKEILSATTTIQYAGAATQRTEVTAAMKLTVAEIREAVRTMKNNKAKKITSMVDASSGYGTSPVDACYVAIVHPNATYDLKGDSAWVSIEKYAGTIKGGAMPGEMGKLDGSPASLKRPKLRFILAEGASSADVYATLIFGANAYGVTRISGEAMKTIRKRLGSGGTADPLNQRSSIGWKASFVTKILDQLNMIKIEHGVTA